MDTIKILITDDHPVVREGLAGMLAGQPDFEVIGLAADGEVAVNLYPSLQPDVVLMDLQLPKLDGVGAIQAIRKADSNANILVLTTYDSDADIVRAIEAGATGYLLKDTPREELFRAIRAVAVGDSVLAPTVATRVMSRMRAPAEEKLSASEIEVLEWLQRAQVTKKLANHSALASPPSKRILSTFTAN